LRGIVNTVAGVFIHGCAFLIFSCLILIFIFVAKEALPLLFSPEVQQKAPLEKMFLPKKTKEGELEFKWEPITAKKPPTFCIIPLFLSTIKITVIAMLFAIPVGIFAAIFSSEFAPPWLREIIKPVLEVLASIPAVVLGFFALIVQASILQSLFGYTFRLNAFNAGLTLGYVIVPIIFTVAEDSLSSVPRSYREGAFALGATRWQTAIKVVLPAAYPGIFAACILGFGRAIGETMIVLMSSGNAAIVSISPFDSARSMTATIALELGEVVRGSAHYHVLFFIGALLFVFTFIINIFARAYVRGLAKKLKGE
jgi:phosphate transport system permease protein